MILAGILSYLIGSIPNAFLIGKLVKHIDIREHGSGNVGATNVFRTVGKGWGSLALVLDMSKGLIVSAVIVPLAYRLSSHDSLIIWQLVFGLLAIGGHTWPIWLKFKGGKGVATSCGVFLGIFPLAVLLALLVWIATAVLTRFVSASSMVAAFSFQIFLFLFYRHVSEFRFIMIIAVLLFIFIVYTHRSNITRLIRGTENKIGKSKK
ncbi:MAG: acyl-phosphate glycerol 3-phosphate acyltransferase [Candidatus Omnitrophica bacterium CG11_big_fil_rev_8_21_14_0_20_45_26]|uniref:Glycerol-3-phosphate acyltransferase n=1 Tax=Candidatus Abzuiibacterium crystallinum TaxID=1974748 RepID=A0A2H0LS77_9BACT|nr:MAG: acyl-phosphate glycerol 3-phosphate acyltransferase [Candidatus Omnitrophica bacterium CG11_big_fil_rev_8_21_14_0_20_45_26]PIW65032.1 MAG: acyl-phosphate glycerol 3-phosphate acyltransferase [Candidatus Omnitrophica bacterium CG12_big_fil_rev_8_21_14_0_65_45_16]